MHLCLPELLTALKSDLLANWQEGQSESAIELLSSDLAFSQVSFDSRTPQTDGLFVCLRGEKTDGHNFANMAEEKGARLILAEQKIANLKIPALYVKDSLAALQHLAAYAREKSKAKVVALTGTCGKSTVKELLFSILSLSFKTGKSSANHNNQLGLSCEILNSTGYEDYLVLEAGISYPKDMPELGEILKPDLAIIINVGRGHTEFLGDRGVAWYKTRLLNYLKPKGQAVVSSDYPELVNYANSILVPKSFFSCKEESSENFAKYLGPASELSGAFSLTIAGQAFQVEAPVFGLAGAEDLLAAALASHKLGVPHTQIAEGLKKATLLKQRFKLIPINSYLIIDDSYNANPLSMQRMLTQASSFKRPQVFILGEMRELGELAKPSHVELGENLATLSPVAIFWKGGEFSALQQGLKQGNYQGPQIAINSPSDLLDGIKEIYPKLPANTLFLVKGSRSNHLEAMVEALKTYLTTNQGLE